MTIYFLLRKKNMISSNPIVNIYIVYKLSSKGVTSSNALKNSLFGAIKVTMPSNTTYQQKYIYSGYGLAFNRTGQFTHGDKNLARNVTIFGVDASNSKHHTNKKQNILVLASGFIQKINNTTIYAEEIYSPNFSLENKTFCLSLHYNGNNSYLYVNGKQVVRFKAKDSEINKYPLALGYIADNADLSDDDIESDKLYGNVYDFSGNYDQISNESILNIHNYLMKKNIFCDKNTYYK